MPAARRAPHALTAAVAACALSLATAAPGLARPAGHGPERACVGCSGTRGAGVRTSSLAGTVDPRAGVVAEPSSGGIDAPDRGTTTPAVVLIAGGALLAGGAAVAGARRVAMRPR